MYRCYEVPHLDCPYQCSHYRPDTDHTASHSLALSLDKSLSLPCSFSLSLTFSLSPQHFNQTVHTAMKQMSVKMKFTFYASVNQTKLFVLPCVIMMMSGTLKLDNVCYKQHCFLLPLVRTASRTSKKRGRASHIQSSPVISPPFTCHPLSRQQLQQTEIPLILSPGIEHIASLCRHLAPRLLFWWRHEEWNIAYYN